MRESFSVEIKERDQDLYRGGLKAVQASFMELSRQFLN